MFQHKRDTRVLLVGFDPFLEDAGVLISGVVQMEFEHGGVGVFFLNLFEQLDDLRS